MARLGARDGPDAGDCVAPLAFERGATTRLHRPSLSRRTNEPDLDNEHENEANERDDYQEIGRHVRGTLRRNPRLRKRQNGVRFCLLKLLNNAA
jgi:hypothetical protein